MRRLTRREMLSMAGVGLAGVAVSRGMAWGQVKVRLSVATGGTGGVYYPLGGGLAALISKYLPDVEATAEVTTASVDNMKLLHAGKVALALTLPDTAYDAFRGVDRFRATGKVGVRTLAALYSNYMHIVALEASGIRSVPDLRGKRVSTGAPGSGTEVKGLRALEAYGLGPKDIRQDRLGVSESASALKDRKLEAFIWDGGLPTAAILDLAATPGTRIRLIPHGEAVPKMVAKYGPLYFVAPIPKGVYPGTDQDVPVAAVTNLLVAHERMSEELAYRIVKLLLEHTPELVAVHKAAQEITLKSAVLGSPIPFHPGALRYYREKHVQVPG